MPMGSGRAAVTFHHRAERLRALVMRWSGACHPRQRGSASCRARIGRSTILLALSGRGLSRPVIVQPRDRKKNRNDAQASAHFDMKGMQDDNGRRMRWRNQSIPKLQSRSVHSPDFISLRARSSPTGPVSHLLLLELEEPIRLEITAQLNQQLADTMTLRDVYKD